MLIMVCNTLLFFVLFVLFVRLLDIESAVKPRAPYSNNATHTNARAPYPLVSSTSAVPRAPYVNKDSIDDDGHITAGYRSASQTLRGDPAFI